MRELPFVLTEKLISCIIIFFYRDFVDAVTALVISCMHQSIQNMQYIFPLIIHN